MKRFFAVTAKDGLAQLHPFKQWFRATRDVPAAEEMNSHQMRNHMKRIGWQIKESEDQVLIIEPGAEDASRFIEDEEGPTRSQSPEESAESSLFALESHLRDYLAKNLNSTVKVGRPLKIVGIEYSTAVGPIDILATNDDNDYFVFELKLQRGIDAALGQLLRYMGWCSKHLGGRQVYGIILASEISEKLRYAASLLPSVTLLEYELQIQVRSVPRI